jgi:hypothetical protein
MSVPARRCGSREHQLPVGRTGQEITVDADPADRDAMERLLGAAAEVLRQHTPDQDGWCRGCLNTWGRLVLMEQCTQAQWAAAVHATYA